MFISSLPVHDEPFAVVVTAAESDTLRMTPVRPPLGGIQHTILQPRVTQHTQLQLLSGEDVCLVSSQVKANIHIIVTILGQRQVFTMQCIQYRRRYCGKLRTLSQQVVFLRL